MSPADPAIRVEPHVADPASGESWSGRPAAEAIARLGGDAAAGLTDAEAAARLARWGPNVLTPRRGRTTLGRLFDQFRAPLVVVLVVAGGVTALLGEWVDSAVILGIVVINAVIGFVQESRAVRAMEALARTMSSTCTVVRDGEARRIDAAEVVPGDTVLLEPGDKVPADLRIIRARDLHLDESALTGESLPVGKQSEPVPPEAILADRRDMAFASTLVTHGHGRGIVAATADRTELGHISRLIAETDEIRTPLTRRIDAFSRVLVWVILVLAAVTFGVGILRGQAPFEMFLAAVALAVGAIPEGLPAAMTVILAIGVGRMARRRAIIRRLPAVETLGSTTVICSDKTGTLTRNQMTVREVRAGPSRGETTGIGWDPEGSVTCGGRMVAAGDDEALEACLRCGVLCNDARLVRVDEQWAIEGDPTEAAMLVAGRKFGLHHEAEVARTPRVAEIPFDSHHCFMATLHDEGPDRPRIVWMKGAPESVLDRCGGVEHPRWLAQAESMAARGMRVLAFARREVPPGTEELDHEDVAGELEFLGLQAMIDPPRSEVRAAVAACRRAGIRVRMITGDHATTGLAIAREIGIVDDADERSPSTDLVMTGTALARLDAEELAERIEPIAVFGRVSPEQKLDLVRALQAGGHVVAMTGDGVNDAPALKQADIGIAMGRTGTEVAREASDMVLTDDDFATIKAAVEEGRAVFDNLTKFIVWTLPTNAGEGLVILTAIASGAVLPLLPVQILWINMTTAGLLGMTLAFERHERDLMDRPPRDPGASLLGWSLLLRIGIVSALLLAGAFGLFRWELARGAELDVARTVAVNAFVVIEAFYLLNCRSLRFSMFSLGLWSNPFLIGGLVATAAVQAMFTYAPFMHSLMQSAPISAGSWGRILAAGLIVYVIVGVEKSIRRRVSLARRARRRTVAA